MLEEWTSASLATSEDCCKGRNPVMTDVLGSLSSQSWVALMGQMLSSDHSSILSNLHSRAHEHKSQGVNPMLFKAGSASAPDKVF